MHLNEAQRLAVTQGDGPALVLAGAGSGKTRVIVERLAYLVSERGVDPRNLLALTFTNRAANEMKARTASRLGVQRLGAWVGTFHSFGLYILRREIDKIGRSSAFTIFDDSDQVSLMKRLIKDLPSGSPKLLPRRAMSWISRLKQDLQVPDAAGVSSEPDEEALRLLWQKYHEALVRANAVDYDDLLVLAARLFLDFPDVRDRYARRYRYVHVDEYQDTNHAQYVMAQRLSEPHKNLFVVGDEDQSIYSWRGANIANILNFEKDFPDARVFRLEQNYRSAKPILDAANALVANNLNRLGKTLWTAQEGGDPVRFYRADDDRDEARFVVDEIFQRRESDGSVAVLFRTNGQSRLFEEALRRKALPYVLIGGTQFYSRKEVKDILAYLRLLINPNDDEALRRIINVPARGIGGVTMDRLEEYARTRGLPLLQVVREVEHDQTFSARVREGLGAFVRMIDDLALFSREATVEDLAVRLLDATGYREYVQETDERDFRDRLEIVDEFVSACAQHDNVRGEGNGGLADFLQELALYSDLDAYDPEKPLVTLITCHAAKGLEFDEVFLVGLEQGLLPHASAFHSESEIEEERRLCYVAMTRARKRLTLVAARERMAFGETRAAEESQFLSEMPSGRIARVNDAFAEPAPRPSFETRRRRADAFAAAPRAEAGAIRMGTRVRHASFGRGTVMYVKGDGAKCKAHIRFDSGRSRDIMVAMAPLTIVEGE
ncbi:MAG TPA: UvrD-helicase domain-containing protein [Candidatus Hydrogenedentes bacterium]|nr:UvrD-helicase domain-containing protein [Candidatus Hydrogenedentota bacterium]